MYQLGSGAYEGRMLDPRADLNRLTELISEALALADLLGRTDAGIRLNEALVDLDGEGRPPTLAQRIRLHDELGSRQGR
jgi:hypothetical protein